MSSRVLQLVVCGAWAAADVAAPVRQFRDSGWDVYVVATPSALAFVSVDELASASGHPVESEFRSPGSPKLIDGVDALVVAPATFSTINKVVYGIADTLAVSRICEAIGSFVPVTIASCMNNGLRRHPAYTGHPPRLQSWGVQVLDDVFDDANQVANWSHLVDAVG